MSVISCIEFLTLFILLLCYCITRPKDAYRPEFDDEEKEKKKTHEKKMKEKSEKLFGKKDQAPESNEVYTTDEHMNLPPKIQEPN